MSIIGKRVEIIFDAGPMTAFGLQVQQQKAPVVGAVLDLIHVAPGGHLLVKKDDGHVESISLAWADVKILGDA